MNKNKNKETNDYLESLGFKCREIINDNDNLYYDFENVVSLKIKKSEKIIDFETLLRKLLDQSFENGKLCGKSEAVLKIIESINNIVR